MANVLFPAAQSQKVGSVWGASDYLTADEGAYFIATNPTAGTAIATTTSVVDDAATASATHAQNVPVMFIKNTSDPSDPNAKNIYLRSLRMLLAQVPTSATTWQLAVRADNNPSAYTSGGSAIVPVNSNLSKPNTTVAQVIFGAVVTALPNNSGRLLARAQVNSAVPVTLDQWKFLFGQPCMDSDQVSGGSGAKNLVLALPPIVIAPGWNVRLEMWGASNAAAPSWEFELDYVERMAGL